MIWLRASLIDPSRQEKVSAQIFGPAVRRNNQEASNDHADLQRTWLTTLFGIGSLLLAADSCAASPLPGGQPLRDRAAGYEMTVLIDGVPAATYEYGGGTYVLGQLGARYTLRVANHSGRRVEAVVSVDGATPSTAGRPTSAASAAI